MTTDSVNQLVERLTQPGALSTARFAALLGASLTPGEANPYWQTHTFTLAQGPFAGGELRTNTARTGALLILEPRDPPGLGREDVDRTALGPRLGIEPNPDLAPEGILTERFQQGQARVALQWTASSRRLRSLVLEWPAP